MAKSIQIPVDTQKLYHRAYLLSLVTIFYNIIEGLVSTFYGAGDETLALFGFGVDSFIEVVSAIGIAHMIMRMRNTVIAERDKFEIQALRITGSAFYILTFSLCAGSIINIIYRAEPITTFWGIIISTISIITMYILFSYKIKVGKALGSEPIISDANCTKTCFYLSFILLGSSLLYEFFKIPYVDAVGSLGIAWYAFREGREAFEKAKSKSLSCDDDCC